MPSATPSEPPSVSLSFANNFWGKDDAGVGPLLDRMHNAKVTCDELKAFYTARAALEDEYSRKLLTLARKPLGSCEAGTLRLSLDVVKAEVEAMGKAHQNIAGQMKSELEEPLAAFAGGMKERRKIVQAGVEKLLKVKTQQTNTVNRTRDKYEQDCLKIKGYLAQGHMVMGQEERKNKAKLEKTQVQLSSTSGEYESAVKVLEETTGRWNRDWKAACDKFQDLEEERIDFLKSSLWTFANVASTVCVSDDASCEKMRLSLEDCDVEKDIMNFIKDSSTGQEIPDPPKFIDFCRGDINDNASETDEEGGYSVAQFPRPINPTIRSSSPQPSVFESHHDPNSSLARDMGHGQSQDPLRRSEQSYTGSQGGSVRGNPYLQQKFAGSAADIPQVPHDPYPPDGMTQFCRTKPPLNAPAERSAQTSPVRPPSRESVSDYSNPSSFTSYGPSSGAQSPVKQMTAPPPQPSVQDEQSPKKRGFFNSPFRRKSKRELDNERESSSQQQTPTATPSNRNTWNPTTARQAGFDNKSSPSRYHSRGTILQDQSMTDEADRADPRANFQLNIGNNVFDVDSPDARKAPAKKQAPAEQELDPIAQALEELKGVTKASSIRQSADRYAGLATPAPNSQVTSPLPGGMPTPLCNQSLAGAQRGTPPPSYDQPISRLGAPPAAHTSRAMQETTRKYVDQKSSMFNASPHHTRGQSYSAGAGQQYNRPASRQGQPGMRATSPAPLRSTSPAPPRATSPRPGMYDQQQQQSYNRPPSQAGPSQAGYQRAPSPNPYAGPNRPRANTNSPAKPVSNYGAAYASRGASPSMNIPRAVSPQPGYAASQSRPVSRAGGAMQIAPSPVQDPYGTQRGRPQSQYYAGQGQGQGQGQSQGNEVGRVRSKSTAEPRQYAKDGRPIIHYARAMYMYQAQIPEELGFAKGDVLAVLRHQDDGWWEAETAGKSASARGLVPSNYLQAC
ncbi:hypothetical protein EJ08DRAFT_584831 [Tothia fuscella]|uniref:Uncharacterized protein n=1 Tax=Tothia fuscella TaxID=1048955 RepID=A0A9P4U1A5_9PEZI|nr:hypothetical protein EJ08DRAFT_584831 [Tothia fuscella]